MKLLSTFLVVVTIAVGGFVAFGVYLYLIQDRMVFFPTRDLEASPGDIGLGFQEVRIDVTDGESIHAWYIPAPSGSHVTGQSGDGGAPTVLFCHGNAGNISHRLETIECLAALGANVMLFDYRGYGQSDGAPSETNMYADAAACYRWLTGSQGVRSDQIVLFGRSLGGAVAIELASRVDCAGLIVESSFTSAKEMGRLMFPYFPIGLLLRYEFNSIQKIGQINCPLLVTHSPSDDLVPFAMGRRLYDRAVDPKRFVELKGGHNERDYMADGAYIEAVRAILYRDPP
ncbi:MAG: alpha/beta hydrolase [candidate division Zixibacteria bacterium]|nr:alpha/beta hydrolase [candidate division Zixibacteria bacterium]